MKGRSDERCLPLMRFDMAGESPGLVHARRVGESQYAKGQRFSQTLVGDRQQVLKTV